MTMLHAGGNSTAAPTRPPAACTASASPWSTPCRKRSKSRSRAARRSTGRPSSAGSRRRAAGDRRQSAEPARHQGALPAGPADFRRNAQFRSRRACSGWRARRPICSAASRSAGVARRRCSATTARCRPRRRSSFPGGLKDYLAADIEGQETSSTDQVFTGKVEKTGQARLGRMGGRLARRRGRLRPFLLQHHPDARRRHARSRPAHRRCCAALKDHAERIGQASAPRV